MHEFRVSFYNARFLITSDYAKLSWIQVMLAVRPPAPAGGAAGHGRETAWAT
jgi:hypothetical protein